MQPAGGPHHETEAPEPCRDSRRLRTSAASLPKTMAHRMRHESSGFLVWSHGRAASLTLRLAAAPTEISCATLRQRTQHCEDLFIALALERHDQVRQRLRAHPLEGGKFRFVRGQIDVGIL